MTTEEKLALEDKVEQILLDVQPMIALHGGTIKLAEIDKQGIVYLDFQGACRDCSIADITLNEGLKEVIMLACDAVTDVKHNVN